MKYLLIFVLTLFQFTIAYSQPPGGGGGGGGGGGKKGGNDGQEPTQRNEDQKKTMEVISIYNVAGLITYEPAVVIKEAKVKKPEEKVLMSQLIDEYNKKIVEIKKENIVKLETIDFTFREKQKSAIENNDLKQLMEIVKKINDELKPIRSEVMEAEKALNTKIESSFSEKINKKWLSYFEEQKEALQPKQPKDNNNNNNNSSRPGPPDNSRQ